MLVICPKCETTFSLPDKLYKPGKKARCSECANVFPLPKPTGTSGKNLFRSKKALAIKLAMFFVVLALGYGIYHVTYRLFFAPSEVADSSQQNIPEKAKSIELEAVQYRIGNPNFSNPLLVVTGKAFNKSSTPIGYIKLKGELLDSTGKALVEQEQMAGVLLTHEDIAIMDKRTLLGNLQNPASIINGNSNIAPGSFAFFTIVFTDPMPAGVTTFQVKIIDVKDPDDGRESQFLSKK